MRAGSAAIFTLAIAGLACTGGTDGLDSADSEAAPEPVQVLLVVDNSSSMSGEIWELAKAGSDLLTALPVGSTVGITTTSVEGSAPGAAGALVGAATSDAAVLEEQLLCSATCWNPSDLPSDPSYSCGSPTPAAATLEYLDCLCGFEAWEGNCGSGLEEPLEAAFEALCRADGSAPDECTTQTPLTSDDLGTEAFLPSDAIVVSDEGDGPRRLAQGDPEADDYLAVYALLMPGFQIATIGPVYDPNSGSFLCNEGGATTWGTQRLIDAAASTGVPYRYVADSGDDCRPASLALPLQEIAAAL